VIENLYKMGQLDENVTGRPDFTDADLKTARSL